LKGITTLLYPLYDNCSGTTKLSIPTTVADFPSHLSTQTGLRDGDCDFSYCHKPTIERRKRGKIKASIDFY
jgi:hypothetical protein